MSAKRMWMVRGEAGRWFEDFRRQELVAIGWPDVGPIQPSESKDSITQRLVAAYKHGRVLSAQIVASQLIRFQQELKVGDEVVTYDAGQRVYLLGEIASEAKFDSKMLDGLLPRYRKVRWRGEVLRDFLSTTAKNSLGATLTLFEVAGHAAEEMRKGVGRSTSMHVTESPPADEEVEIFRGIEDRSTEFIKDSVSTLDWEDMQELVAGILRAMGYKTRISPSGPDRGKDIVASPDGFGFENPRIVVEVKHRNGQMGSKEVRSFLGGRHSDDRGLYVSTGGFSKDAYYEAERAGIPLMLWDLSDLVRALVENYENLDASTKQLVPLRRIYWPSKT